MNRTAARAAAVPCCAGFSLLELSVAIALVSAAAGILLNALLYYQELGEKIAVDWTLVNMRSGVRFQIAERIMQGRETELEQLLGSNPVSWLAKPPPGYAGELNTPIDESVQPGSWFFDEQRRELGYVPRYSSHLELEPPEKRALRWRIHGARSPRGDIEDIALISVTRYTWF